MCQKFLITADFCEVQKLVDSYDGQQIIFVGPKGCRKSTNPLALLINYSGSCSPVEDKDSIKKTNSHEQQEPLPAPISHYNLRSEVRGNLLLPMAHLLRSHALLIYFKMVEGKVMVAMVVVVMVVVVVVVEKDVARKEALFNMILFRTEALFNMKVLFQNKRVKRQRLILWMLYLSQR